MALTKINNNTLSAITGLPAGVGGKVLQVVYASGTAAHNTSSTTYADVISKAITPVSSSSTIYVHFASRVYTGVDLTEHNVKFLRDTTDLDTYFGIYTNGGAVADRQIWEYFDSSHSTTSSITYKMQHRVSSTVGSRSASINPNGASDGVYYLTLMEIA